MQVAPRGVILTFYTFCSNKTPEAKPRAFCSQNVQKVKITPLFYTMKSRQYENIRAAKAKRHELFFIFCSIYCKLLFNPFVECFATIVWNSEGEQPDQNFGTWCESLNNRQRILSTEWSFQRDVSNLTSLSVQNHGTNETFKNLSQIFMPRREGSSFFKRGF